MNIKYKLISLLTFSLLGCLSNNAQAEYYIVYPAPSQKVYTCLPPASYKDDNPFEQVVSVECTEGAPNSHGCDVYLEENADFDFDRRTADDVGADMDIDY
jgi:hypothetical protein